jgi:hypothetical protein
MGCLNVASAEYKSCLPINPSLPPDKVYIEVLLLRWYDGILTLNCTEGF